MVTEVYYPLSKIESRNRDIALLELENAHNASSSQSKVYTQFANVLIGFSTVILTIILNVEKFDIKHYLTDLNLLVFSLFMYLMGIILLRYFADLQKEITINARKVVTLRSMLGLDYSSVQLTLPKDRIEGATNPFRIKFFNGWFKFQCSPVWILSLVVGIIWTIKFYTNGTLYFYFDSSFDISNINCTWLTGIVVIFLTYFTSYRFSLFDRHENVLLHFSILLATLFRIKFFKNFEYSLYRARLSYIDLDINKIKYENLKKTIVKIEDSRFFSHRGIDSRSFIRALLSQNNFLRKKNNWLPSGGSTIEMQLARTIFIPTSQSKYKRKILEIFVALWLSMVLSKDDILKIYIGSVRFGPGIMGLKSALKHYFCIKKYNAKYDIPIEVAFVLTERLSNISNSVDENRVKTLLKHFPQIDKYKVQKIYNLFIAKKLNLKTAIDIV